MVENLKQKLEDNFDRYVDPGVTGAFITYLFAMQTGLLIDCNNEATTKQAVFIYIEFFFLYILMAEKISFHKPACCSSVRNNKFITLARILACLPLVSCLKVSCQFECFRRTAHCFVFIATIGVTVLWTQDISQLGQGGSSGCTQNSLSLFSISIITVQWVLLVYKIILARWCKWLVVMIIIAAFFPVVFLYTCCMAKVIRPLEERRQEAREDEPARQSSVILELNQVGDVNILRSSVLQPPPIHVEDKALIMSAMKELRCRYSKMPRVKILREIKTRESQTPTPQLEIRANEEDQKKGRIDFLGEMSQTKVPLNKGQNECIICMTEFDEGEFIVKLRCNESHIFHEECLTGWVTNNFTCPLCREPILKNP